jgi:hydrogenase/urease accessory protein HupE
MSRGNSESSVRWRCALSTAVVVVLCTASLRGHEIGTTRVSVVVAEDGTYAIEVVTDAVALAEKLEVPGAAVASPGGDAPPLQASLAGVDEAFRQRVNVAFDGSGVHPDVTYAVSPGADALSPPTATIRLRGQVPAGARQFTWSYGWTFASYALTVRRSAAGDAVTEWLEGDQTSVPHPVHLLIRRADWYHVARRYLTLGVTHIVPRGLDHMLFVLGIYLLSGRARSVLWQVSAFTVAHSITLGLSTCGVVAASPRIVEPLIALSIAYVAIENIFVAELRSWRVALVFAFGLLHGMGFAGALTELDLPRAEFVTALLTFNLGVEAGQMVVIGAAFLLVGWHCANRTWYRSRIVLPASSLIACMAVYWTIERLSF